MVVARGPGWLLAWPRERWDELTPAQQQDVIDAQVALMSQNVPANGTQRAPQVVRGDKSPPARPAQPPKGKRARSRELSIGG